MVQTPPITQSDTQTLSLELPDDIRLKVSDEQFEKLAIANRDLRLERSATGELIVNPPTGWETGERNFSITAQLGAWHETHYELGKAFDSSTAFKLPDGATLSPDASWISQERWDSLSTQQKGTFANVCPDFVVELRSGSDNLRPLQKKLQQYMDNGAKLGWLIDPKNKRVEIYRQGTAVEQLLSPVELSGEDILPGFVLNLRRIWS